jgi:AcrR family transcriptional regulator
MAVSSDVRVDGGRRCRLPVAALSIKIRAITRFSYSHPEAHDMPPRAPTKPRKRAAQERSRATVDALVEATARILVGEGFDKASTNRIAAVAGVSIGSLYQYFPGKEALVMAVAQRHRHELVRMVRGALAEVAAEPLARGVAALVAAAVEAHRVDPALHRVLAEEIPRLGELEDAARIDQGNHSLFREWLEGHRSELRVPDMELAVFVCATTVEALTHHAVLHHADVLAGARMEALVDETTRLILGYLTG